MKKFLTLIILVGFAGSVFLGFTAMKHGTHGVMSNNCPITSACPAETTGTLTIAAHYLSMYQAFTNGLVPSIVAQELTCVLFFVAVVYVFRNYVVLIQHLLSFFVLVLSRIFAAKLYRPQALVRWLSLLVNSPSFN